MEHVTRTTNKGDNYMSRYNLPVNSTDMMVDSKAKNTALKEKQWQSLYRGVYSDPYTTGRGAIKFVKPLNYFGINHYIPTPTTQRYYVGLPTGSTKSPLPPLMPKKQYTMCG